METVITIALMLTAALVIAVIRQQRKAAQQRITHRPR